MSQRTAVILFVEDELSLLSEFARVLERAGHRVLAASQPDEVLRIIRSEPQIDLMITDLQLPMDNCREIGFAEAAGGKHAGFVLAGELRRKFKRTPIIVWTKDCDRDTRQRAFALGNSRLVAKSTGAKPVLELVDDALDGFRSGARPRSLLVHGHDLQTLREVKTFLQADLRFPEPIVLRDQPNFGNTIIEKLETQSLAVDLVFVLLTPDDTIVTDSSSAMTRRARQNVIFELGYFLGLLGRHSGRVILLYREPVELPSDIHGMVAVNITHGMEAARRELTQELREWT